jgi:DNA (cytosine-5)-methyltransferase 1
MKFVDLFAGCGGMSLGFEMAGFDSVAAVEIDERAAETYAVNRKGKSPIVEDIRNLQPNSLGISGMSNLILVGGPPCQGHSLSGDRDPKDPRNSLFMDFLRIADDSAFEVFVGENVTGILSSKTSKGEPIVDIIRQESIRCGYHLDIWMLNAFEYGVPQARRRVFFIGTRHGLKITQPPCVVSRWSVWDAISDLPQIDAGGGYEVDEYRSRPQNDYQTWARLGACGFLHNHVSMRHTTRLIERFKTIPQGGGLADAPPEHAQRKRGDATSISGKVFSQNNCRVNPDSPCPTVAASFQSNFIHPYLHRNFTAREAARIQSFPDRYIFKGKRTKMSWEKGLSQYQQIGNAVPPLLAKAIANSIRDHLKKV